MEVLTGQLGSRERLKILVGFLLSLLISTQAPSYGLVLKHIQVGVPYKSIFFQRYPHGHTKRCT